jgi:hypothetical protein
LKLHPGEPPPFRPEDVILQTGDIVYIRARRQEFFYTGGILPPGKFPLPRDYDLDIIQAVLQIGGPLLSSGVNPINIQGQIAGVGIGFPSPSWLTVLRRTPGGGQVPIRVSLNRALTDPRERILVLPDDVLLLQERPDEGFARYFNQTFFNFNLMWQAIHGEFITGKVTVNTP